MTERRYNEAEVAAIIQRATEAVETAQGRLPSNDGLTLSEIEDIGRQAGIDPVAIRHAAHRIDVGGRPMFRTILGFPLGVGRTVEIDRRLSDEEWERLVVDLRETFDARGTVRREGSLRQWTNGNLQALLEPTATGQRLRIRTIKGQALSMMTMGMGVFGMGVLISLVAVLNGLGEPSKLVAAGALALGGVGMFGAALLRLPRWAKLRSQQMEDVAARLAIPSQELPNE
jgi:hypothetical protein